MDLAELEAFVRDGDYQAAVQTAPLLPIDDAATLVSSLVSAAERLPPDVPVPKDGAAQLALELIERVAPKGSPRWLALRGNALRLLGPQRDDAALAALHSALEITPEDARLHYDLGLLHKTRGRFAEALAATRRARELGLSNRAVHFNEAIAATALGDGSSAVDRWRALGIDARVNEAKMPVVDGLPPAQVRVPASGAGYGTGSTVPDHAAGFELAWVAPISPCHGVLSTPTYRDTPIDYGDVVLWDSAPADVGMIEGQTVPRFPLLAVLHRGDEHRLRFAALEQRPGAIAEFGSELPEGCAVFVHRERVESVCSRCASGELLVRHRHEPPQEHRIVYGKIVANAATPLADIESALVLKMRQKGEFQLAVPALYEALGDTKRAGQEHQAFVGIERIGTRR